jgi:transcriptional regulator with XRE-family HTH domain
LIPIAKYEQWLTEQGLAQITQWARNGLTDEQIAHNMGVAYSTLREWAKKYSALSAAIKGGKDSAIEQVENALFKKATGFQWTEETTEIYQRGETVKEKHIRKVTKYAAPDTAAMIFFLKNRHPDKWSDRPEAQQTDDEPLRELLQRWDDASKQ